MNILSDDPNNNIFGYLNKQQLRLCLEILLNYLYFSILSTSQIINFISYPPVIKN